MKLDHIVHAIQVTPEDMTKLANSHGFHAVKGGQHEKWGTANALHFLSSSYIEWLAVEDEEIASQADHPLTELLVHDLETGPGFLTVCLRTDDIESLNTRLTSKGFETTGVLDASRKTPEGQLLKWKMLFIKEEVSNNLPMPFFIEWEQSQEEKYANLSREGQLSANVQFLELSVVQFGVNEPEKTITTWADLLDASVEGHAIQLENTRLEFVSNTSSDERLQQIDIKGTGVDNTIEIEGALYRFLP